MVYTLIFYAVIHFIISFFATFHLIGVHNIDKRFNEDFHDYGKTNKTLHPIRTHIEIFQVFPLLMMVLFGAKVFDFLNEANIPRIYGVIVYVAILIGALILAIELSERIFDKYQSKTQDDEQ